MSGSKGHSTTSVQAHVVSDLLPLVSFRLLYHFFKSNSTFFSIVTKFCHQIYISVHCQSVNYTEIPAIYTGQLCPSTRWLCSVIPQDICMPQVQPLLHLPLPS